MATRNPVWVQQDYRFRKDDGDLSTATDYAANNTAASIVADTVFRLRVNVGETGNANTANSTAWKIQFSSGGGAWTDVGAATTIQYAASAQGIADATNEATQRLPTISGSAYTSAWMEFDTNNTLTSRTWADNYTEYEFCLKIASGTAAGTSIQLRAVLTGGTVPTITNTPTLTVQAPPATYNETVSESAAATDSTTGGLTFAATTEESAAATDTTSALYTANASVSETSAATDDPSAIGTFAQSVSESTAATDTTSSTGVFAASVSESTAATDSAAGGTAFDEDVSESVAATDTTSAATTFSASVSETAAATDTTTETVTGGAGGTTYNETVSETVAVTDEASETLVSARRGDGARPRRIAGRVTDSPEIGADWRKALERLARPLQKAEKALEAPTPPKKAKAAVRAAVAAVEAFQAQAPTLGVDWSAVLAEMQAADEQAAYQAALRNAILAVEAQRRAFEEDEEEVMLLLMAA